MGEITPKQFARITEFRSEETVQNALLRSKHEKHLSVTDAIRRTEAKVI